MAQNYYQKIMDIPGIPEIKSTLSQWQCLSENLGKMPQDLPILLPDYLMNAPDGIGRSTLFHLMARYLDDAGLMLFQGDRRVVEYYLDYCAPGQPFVAFGRFLEEISAAAGFRSKFRGLVAINCSAWIGHFEERHMEVLLEYLMDNSRDWLIFIVVDTDDQEAFRHIESVASSYLRIHTLRLTYPETEDMVGYMEKQINAYGFECSDDARALLADTLEHIRSSRYFSGYETLDLMVEEILYSVYSERASISKTLVSQQLGRFAPDGAFIHQMQENYNRRLAQIGFNGGD